MGRTALVGAVVAWLKLLLLSETTVVSLLMSKLGPFFFNNIYIYDDLLGKGRCGIYIYHIFSFSLGRASH